MRKIFCWTGVTAGGGKQVNNRGKLQAEQFQNSVLLRSFHDRQNFCLPRAHLDVRSMSAKEKMKSYLVESL